MSNRAFVQLVLAMIYATGLMALADDMWHLGAWGLLLWLMLTALLFWPLRRIYP